MILVASLVPFSLLAQTDDDHNFEVAKNLEVFNSVYKALDMVYVDTLSADEVVGTAIKSMLGSLDPYTTYYPEEKLKDWKFRMTGNYVGMGSIIRYLPTIKNTVVVEPYEGMPAAEVGLRMGDVILAIDDSSMVGKSSDYVSQRLRGDAGTTFVLKVRRPSTGKTMKFKITRRAITTPAISYYGLRPDGVGYINLEQFVEGAAKEVRRAFIDMKKQGMRSLVLDLRRNGGGLEQEAVSLVNLFVPRGCLIVSNKGKMERANHDYYTTVEPLDTVMPIVVLVGESTASASEITSGALQDLDRAVIVGTRTYGKGLVQAPLDMPYNGRLTVTTSKYYIPSGRCIQAFNYNHANGGYVEHVPDSLTRVFYTKGGREVRDGGGIMPDVEIKPDTMSNLSHYLLYGDSTETVFNYEVEYIGRHNQIAPAAEFELSDADFDDFCSRVLKSGFTYDRQSEKYLDELEKLVRFEGYYDDAKTEFEALKNKLKHNLAKDLDFNREELKEMISSDIVTSYYYQKGAVEYGLKHDKQMAEAVRLLLSPSEYEGILKVKK